jgi:translation elongation factor EF-G
MEATELSIVLATAPMAALFDFENDLARIAGGEASVAMLFHSYAEVPYTSTEPDDTFPAAAALRA